jgi:chromosome segregation ATPase
MDTEQLKKNFEDQLKSAEAQIVELEANLTKAKEYRTKLQGGLETLAILSGEPESPGPEAALPDPEAVKA